MVFLSEGLSSPSTVRECHIKVVKPTSQPHEVSFVLFPYISRVESCVVMRQVVPDVSQPPLYYGQDHETTASDRPGEVELRDTHQQQVGELNNPLIHPGMLCHRVSLTQVLWADNVALASLNSFLTATTLASSLKGKGVQSEGNPHTQRHLNVFCGAWNFVVPTPLHHLLSHSISDWPLPLLEGGRLP